VAWWDWSLDTREPFGTTNLEDVWHPSGYGGNGVGKDHCVQTGPFRQGVWSRVRPPFAGPGPDCLVRDFYGEPPEEVDVEEVLKTDSFHNFEEILRLVLHNGVHCNINGTMCTLESASAPEFFLHHGFVDKIWDDWQKKSHKNKHAYFPSIKKNMPGTKLKPSELIDLSKQPGGIRVEYEPFQREEDFIDKIKGEVNGLFISYVSPHDSTMIYLLLLFQARALLNYVKSGAEHSKASPKWLSTCSN